MTAQGSKTRPKYMSPDNSVVCGRCVFDSLKTSQEVTTIESFKVKCAEPTELAAYVAVRDHNHEVHGTSVSRVFAAILGEDERWHLVDLEPTIQL